MKRKINLETEEEIQLAGREVKTQNITRSTSATMIFTARIKF